MFSRNINLLKLLKLAETAEKVTDEKATPEEKDRQTIQLDVFLHEMISAARIPELAASLHSGRETGNETVLGLAKALREHKARGCGWWFCQGSVVSCNLAPRDSADLEVMVAAALRVIVNLQDEVEYLLRQIPSRETDV